MQVKTAQLSVTLVPAGVSTQVTVSAPLPVVDPFQTSVTSIIDKEFIEESPVRTRNALDFVLLAPGVGSPPPSSAAGAQAPLATSGFTFGGLRKRSNSIAIDGFDNNDETTVKNVPRTTIHAQQLACNCAFSR